MTATTIALRDSLGNVYRIVPAPEGAVTIGDQTLQVVAAPDGSFTVKGARNTRVWAIAVGETRWVFVDGRVFTFEPERAAVRRGGSRARQGPLTAPMPATVRAIHVAPGDTIARGDVVLVLEAMKMELPVRAGAGGRIRAVLCREGDLVQPHQALVELEGDAS